MAVDEALGVRVTERRPDTAAAWKPAPSPKDVIRDAQEQAVQMVDLRFTDLVGSWQHFSIPVSELSESLFREGIGFDGSSIRGFQKIHESDMLLFPDPGRTFVDPSLDVRTLVIVCDIADPITLQPYTRDPRYVAKKAEAYLRDSGIADTSYWGPECEFYIFNSVRYDQNAHEGYYHIDSDEGIWNSGKNGTANLGFRPRFKEGYFPVPPVDMLQDLRSRIVLALQESGIPVEVHHHEVGTAGQTEIDMRFDTLVSMADKVLQYKSIVKTVCYQHGYTATFMPKPLFGDNGSGMHTHQSLWKDGAPLFFDKEGYALLSDTARWYIGGLLAHAPALLAFAAPTTNSYRRLVPGYEAPIKLAYSARNRSACVRIPTYSSKPAARRLEFRSPDPMCNPYFAFSAMLMAGIDGIKRRIEPPKPVEADLYELEGPEADRVKDLPGSLPEVLDALEKDHEFLLQDGVFTDDVIDTYISYKREREVDPIRLRPHPYEFHLYYDG
ncbi:MAG: type I glutamate--ammonia ligase [Candidatus Dormibacteraeota bacterium]|nr:type I glutamate--ammonia ligase [Candidatus Dormibacteraeota bacterium]